MFRFRFANRFKADRRPSEGEVIELFGDLARSVGKKWGFGFDVYDYWVDGVPMEVSSKGAWGHYFMSKDRKVLDKLEKICGRDLDNFQFVIYYEFSTHIIGICMYVLGTDTDWEILYQDDILIKPDTSVGVWTILENTRRFVEHMLKWVDDEYRMITRKTSSRKIFRAKNDSSYRKVTPKQLKDMVKDGIAEDITSCSDIIKLKREKGLECIGIGHGIYGPNCAMYKGDDGKIYVITARNTNLMQLGFW